MSASRSSQELTVEKEAALARWRATAPKPSNKARLSRTLHLATSSCSRK